MLIEDIKKQERSNATVEGPYNPFDHRFCSTVWRRVASILNLVCGGIKGKTARKRFFFF